MRRGIDRIQGWEPTPAERRLAAAAEELAGLVIQAEAGLVSRLPRQLVHGDFWDNNVLFRHGRPVLLADFEFMGERAASTTWRSRCSAPAPTSTPKAAWVEERVRRVTAAPQLDQARLAVLIGQ